MSYIWIIVIHYTPQSTKSSLLLNFLLGGAAVIFLISSFSSSIKKSGSICIPCLHCIRKSPKKVSFEFWNSQWDFFFQFSNTVPFQKSISIWKPTKKGLKNSIFSRTWGLKGENQLWKTLYKMVFALLAARFILIKCRLYEKRFSLDSLSFLPEDYDKCEAMRRDVKVALQTYTLNRDRSEASGKEKKNQSGAWKQKKLRRGRSTPHQHSSWIDNSIVLKSTKPWKIRLITSSNNGNKAWWRA